MVTIRDIAERAAVSVSTASRALNNNLRISRETRLRIQSIATEMGYQPNYNAKTLTNGEANAVGVIFPPGDMSTAANPFFVDLLMGINTQLRLRNAVLSVAIANTTEELTKNVLALISQSLIHHFILLYSKANDPVVELLKSQGVQYVLVGDPTQDNERYVNNNNRLAGAKALEYLNRHFNSRHVLFVESEMEQGFEKQRRLGFESAAQQLGVKRELLKLPDKAMQHLDQAVAQYLDNRRDIDGIMTTDDLIGMMVYQLTRQQLNRQVPLISFNKSQSNTLIGDQVRFVELYPQHMGEAAVRVLFSETKQFEMLPFTIEKV